jgi:DNA mismatch endonuclease (patch repair protein)
MMSGIRSKNTRPEIALRTALHRQGFRYRLHSSRVPGKPDLVFPAHNAAVFIHGCFWHGHDCKYFKMPGSRTEFWQTKFAKNRARDEKVRGDLEKAGWRYMVVWECAVRGQGKDAPEKVAAQIGKWLRSRKPVAEIRGT